MMARPWQGLANETLARHIMSLQTIEVSYCWLRWEAANGELPSLERQTLEHAADFLLNIPLEVFWQSKGWILVVHNFRTEVINMWVGNVLIWNQYKFEVLVLFTGDAGSFDVACCARWTVKLFQFHRPDLHDCLRYQRGVKANNNYCTGTVYHHIYRLHISKIISSWFKEHGTYTENFNIPYNSHPRRA